MTKFSEIVSTFLAGPQASQKTLWLVDPPEPGVVFPAGVAPVELERLVFDGAYYKLLPYLQFLRPKQLFLVNVEYLGYWRETMSEFENYRFMSDISISFSRECGFLEKREMLLFLFQNAFNKTVHFSSKDAEFLTPCDFRRTYAHILSRYTYKEIFVVRYFGIVWELVYRGNPRVRLQNYS